MFALTFGVALLAELVDKTQLLIFTLALKHKAPYRVFWGAVLAHALVDGFAILFGSWAGSFVAPSWLPMLVGLSFMALGVWSLREEEHEHPLPTQSPFVSSFAMVFVSEFGDKTQIASGILATQYPAFLVFLAFALGVSIITAVNVMVGHRLRGVANADFIRKLTALLFILVGSLFLL